MDGLANILSLHQRFDEALVLYERAVQVWPGNYASMTNWAPGCSGDRFTRPRRLGRQRFARKAKSRRPTS